MEFDPQLDEHQQHHLHQLRCLIHATKNHIPLRHWCCPVMLLIGCGAVYGCYAFHLLP